MRTLIGVDRLDVQHVADHRILVGDAVGAQDFARQLGAFPRHPDVVPLAHRDVLRRHRPSRLQPRQLVGEELALRDLRDHPRQLFLDQLVTGDRLAGELHSLAGVLERRVVALHRRAEPAPADAVARLVQGLERAADAAGASQDVVGRNPAVLEGELAGHRRPQRELAVLLGAHEALGALLDQEAPDSLVGARPHDRDIGDAAVRDPLLGAVQHPVVPVAARAGAHRRGVRPEIRLRETEAANHPAAGQPRDEAVLLLLRAEGEDRVHDQGALHRDHAADAGIAALQLLHHEPVRDIPQAGESVLREVRSEQVQIADLGRQLHRRARIAMALLDDGLHPLVDELTDGISDQALLAAEQRVELHEINAGESLQSTLLDGLWQRRTLAVHGPVRAPSEYGATVVRPR